MIKREKTNELFLSVWKCLCPVTCVEAMLTKILKARSRWKKSQPTSILNAVSPRAKTILPILFSLDLRFIRPTHIAVRFNEPSCNGRLTMIQRPVKWCLNLSSTHPPSLFLSFSPFLSAFDIRHHSLVSILQSPLGTLSCASLTN